MNCEINVLDLFRMAGTRPTKNGECKRHSFNESKMFRLAGQTFKIGNSSNMK